MKCPFKEQLKSGSMVCDYGGMRHEPGVVQCPTPIFNKCQSGDEDEILPEDGVCLCSE